MNFSNYSKSALSAVPLLRHERTWVFLLCMGIYPKASALQADELFGDSSEPNTIVALEQATNLIGLIAAEGDWLSTNFPGHQLLSFSFDTHRISPRPQMKRKGRDMARIKANGQDRKVIFIYDTIPEETSIK